MGSGTLIPMNVRPRGWAGLLLSAGLGAVLAGCDSGPREVIIVPGGFAGPALSWSKTDRTHIAIFSAPGPGWAVELDESRDGAPAPQAFVTLRSPPPEAGATPGPQVLVGVDTRIVLTSPIEVYARVAGARVEARGIEYRLAGSRPAQQTPSPLPPGLGLGPRGEQVPREPDDAATDRDAQ